MEAAGGGEQSSLRAAAVSETIVAETILAETDIRDWIALLKPRVMSLVVFTGLIGLLVAPGRLHPVLAFTAVLCIAVAAGAASVFPENSVAIPSIACRFHCAIIV